MALPLIGLAAGALGSLLVVAIRFVIVKMLIALGFAVVSYVGVSIIIDYVFDVIRSGFASGDSLFLAMFSLSRLDDCLEILAAAVSAHFAIKQVLGFFNRSSFGNFS